MQHTPGITGLGYYLPERVLTNAELERMVDTTDEWIVARTGIRERRIAPPEEAFSDLGLRAANRALHDAGVDPSELDMIIVATDTPDMIFPNTASLIQRGLGAWRAACFDLLAACSGFIYGLSVASQYVRSGTHEKILVVGGSLLSRITDWQDRNTCVLFGDGAGAAVVGRVEAGFGLLSVILGADGRGATHLSLPAGGSRLPASHETVEQGMHYLHMNGREVFKFAVRVFEEAAEEAIVQAGISKEDIDLFVPHQANIRIIEAAAKRYALPKEKVMVNLDRYGNISAATIPVALQEAREAGRVTKGDHILMAAFGAGLTYAAAVLRWAL